MHSKGYYNNIRPEVSEIIPNEPAFILEIGCGEGNFSNNFTGYIEYWGVEPFAVAAHEASKKITKILLGTYDEVCNEIPDAYFDLIICNDVIEHIADSDKFLSDIKQKIKPNGYLVGSIPNVRYYKNLFNLLIKKDWNYTDQGILDNTHLRFFTERSFIRTVTKNNYAVEIMLGISSTIYKSKRIKSNIKNILITVAIFMSFGFYKDIQYVQFAFVLRPIE